MRAACDYLEPAVLLKFLEHQQLRHPVRNAVVTKHWQLRCISVFESTREESCQGQKPELRHGNNPTIDSTDHHE
jgi:hypothetical protein